jgi:hypothetical protein
VIVSRDRDLLHLGEQGAAAVEFRRAFPDLRILPPEGLLAILSRS